MPLVSASTSKSSETILDLHDQDEIYSTLRDLNFSAVGKELNVIAKRLKEEYDERHKAKTVTQIKNFVNKLGGLQSYQQNLKNCKFFSISRVWWNLIS